MKNYFFLRSCRSGANTLDWIRSIYFSLLGSAALTLVLKVKSLNLPYMLVYIAGLFFFLLGLILAVRITNRFKNFEKDYDKDTKINKDDIKLHSYYEKKDKSKSWQHLFIYTLWIPASICIGFSGYYLEQKSNESSLTIKESLNEIKNRQDSTIKILSKPSYEVKSLQGLLDSMYSISIKKSRQIDSLNQVIVKPKAKKGRITTANSML